MLLVLEHDNGVAGQRGFSDCIVNSIDEVKNILETYEARGIMVYNFSVYNN